MLVNVANEDQGVAQLGHGYRDRLSYPLESRARAALMGDPLVPLHLRPKVSRDPEPLDCKGKGKDDSKGQGKDGMGQGKDGKGQGKDSKGTGKAEPRDVLHPLPPDADWLCSEIDRILSGPRVGRCMSRAKVHRDLCHGHWLRSVGPRGPFLEWYEWVKQLV